MAYTPIDKSTDYFNTKLYTGTGNSNAQTGVGFQPDWVWLKNRSATANHHLVDAPRGITKELRANLANSEADDNQLITAFGSDGFTVGTSGSGNTNGDNYVAWNWKANGAGATNEDGSINTTKTSASTTSGFSIVSYTGTNSTATVGHGLGVAPKMIIWKERGNTNDWCVWHTSLSATQVLILNTTAATASDSNVMGTLPTSSLFSIGQGTRTNRNGGTYIAYCFAEVQGFSKFSSFIGNGNADAPFVYTGFKPAFIVLKNASTTQSWQMYTWDMQPFNEFCTTSAGRLKAESNEAQSTKTAFDMLSNGFKMRTDAGDINASGNEIIYWAFAENPFVTSTGIPGLAR